ncbi:rho GTPase-activating protein 27 isoform X3 [Pleuronectes platessa]|uniref:rho GTPase-activating protein 27 isoform X3 n=1 Tax=Pleuronectes platessa TaxID=8262 RepID=UPI00232A300E|nr:rho GTPase-activating protein 27 isoform X3 [Pleuronectes platessa]
MAATSSVFGKGLGLILVEFEYEYQGRDGVLVSIKPNERYVLLAKTNDHWWQVRRDSSSKPFYIPAKYVKELPVDFPSPLDFDDPTSAEPVSVPVAAPVPVPIPVPKTLEESNGNRIKQGDEVTIRLKPDASTGYRKTENRMSTFGVPLDFHDLSQLVQTSNPLGGPAETGTATTSRNTYITKGGLSKKQPLVPGCLDDHKDSVKPRLPTFSPADPLSASRPQNQAIPVEMPVVPVVPIVPPNDDIQSTCSLSEICPDHQDSLMEPEEEEEEEMSVEESSKEEEDLLKEQDSNHIYESIQDLNLDLEVLVRERVSPGPGPELATAPAPTQDHSSLGHISPIYANISVKKTSHDSDDFLIPPPPTEPAPFPTGHTPSPSSVSSSDIKSPASPISLQDEWQVHTDHDSGRRFYFHPVTRQTTWTDPHSPTAPPAALASPSPLLPPASSQPPLPEEDYPVEGANDTVFTTSPQQPAGLIPRVQMELKDGSSSQLRMQEPQRTTGDGVSEEGASLQVRSWRHSVAEDTFALGHRRNVSDLTEVMNRRLSPDGSQFSDRHRLKRNLSNRSTDSHQLHGHQLEKAGIINKTKVVDNGKRIRKNWSQSWTVLHGGILTFHRDPKSAPTGNASKASQIVPEYTVDLRGSSVSWAAKDKSSKKNVVELKTRQGCEFLMQYDTESIISDWLKVIQDAVRQLEHDVVTEDEDDAASDREDKERRKTTSTSSSGVDSEQTRVRTKLRRFLQRRPTLQSVKEKGYIRDNVFGCHLDTLCHREHTTIPTFLQKCIRVVERRGLDVDGIYRVSGNLAVIQKLRHKADHEEQLDLDDGLWQEIHVITGALKLFLRELPEPLFPFSCFDKFIAAIQVPDHSLRVSYMKDLVRSLPLPNHDTMELLFKHLHKVTEHRDSNRMSVQSVAIVFGPTLLRPQTESPNMTINMVFQSQIVELMLNEFQLVFSQT